MAEINKPDMSNLWASGGAIITPSLSKIDQGWTAEIPPHQWENYIQNRQDRGIGYMFQHGVPEWDVTTEYFANKSIVQVAGVLYVALTNSTNLNPTTNPTNWKLLVIPANTTGPVVGSIRNGKMYLPTASATGTFTADEVVVESVLGGIPYRIANYNQAINLATVGAGGMDTGTSPVNGWVALYAIYNPTTGAKSILAVNATAAVAPEVYGGANMPTGYTASALISVWPTFGGGQLKRGFQQDRRVSTFNSVYGGPPIGSFTILDVSSAVPKNAKTGQFNWAVSGPTPVFASIAICPTIEGQTAPGYTNGASYVPSGIASSGADFREIPFITAQRIYHVESGDAANTFVINCYGYTF